MRSSALRELVGGYVMVRMDPLDEPETVRLLDVRAPTAEELRFGGTWNRVHIRRFLGGGWVDTWVWPRDVLAPAEPEPRILAVIRHVEEKVGPAPKRRW